jgi:hypothetical protein
MAVSNALMYNAGNQSRCATLAIDMDSNASFLTGTAIGVTVVTKDEEGNDVDASAAVTYTSTTSMTPEELVQAFVDHLDANVTGIRPWWTKNSELDVFLIHMECLHRVAWDVTISSPTFVPGT